jgi:hypothetical protein
MAKIVSKAKYRSLSPRAKKIVKAAAKIQRSSTRSRSRKRY